MAKLSQFININKGSVTDPRILRDAVKGFIRNNATLYESNLRRAWSSRLSELELKLSTLDNSLQQHFDDRDASQYDLVKRDSNAILKWRAESLMHWTHRTHYFNEARPSHLLSLRLMNIYLTSPPLDQMAVICEHKPPKWMPLSVVSMLTCIAQRFFTIEIHATNSWAPSNYPEWQTMFPKL